MTKQEVCESCIHWVRMYFDKEDSPNICELALMGCPYAPKEKQIEERDKE